MPSPCPICGRLPQVERCEPWARKYGPAPWYAGCYREGSNEHYIGGNGDTRASAIAEWERQVRLSLGQMRPERSVMPLVGSGRDE